MKIQKSYHVLPAGMISGGALDYVLDTVAGTLEVQGEVDISAFLYHNTFPFAETLAIDPKHILSANLKVGSSVSLHGMGMTVLSINSKQATVQVVYTGAEAFAMGKGVIDLSGEYASLLSLNVQAQVQGHQLNLIVAAN